MTLFFSTNLVRSSRKFKYLIVKRVVEGWWFFEKVEIPGKKLALA